MRKTEEVATIDCQSSTRALVEGDVDLFFVIALQGVTNLLDRLVACLVAVEKFTRARLLDDI